MAKDEIHDAELIDDSTSSGKRFSFPEWRDSEKPVTAILALVMVFILLSSTILYVILSDNGDTGKEVAEMVIEEDPRTFVTDRFGMAVDEAPLEMDFIFSDVGETGKEPSIGITSSGCIFFIAMEKVMRSCDYGGAWQETQDPIQCSPTTSDPYGWVDPITDRIFDVQMIGLETSWICWSDDDGESWLGNPHDSGTTPINDHIKLASGPWTNTGPYAAIGSVTTNLYETAVYYCYNKLAGIFCFTSFDGGATFDTGGQIIGLATTNGGLHGAISTAADGTVYLTPRVATPTVIVSKDNGFSWFERSMGEDVGTPNPRKNSEVSADTDSNAYHVWTGADEGVYMSRSFDSGETWEQESIRISPKGVISSVFPQTDAGDPGRIAITYLGSEDSAMLGEDDLDGQDWDGNAHYAVNNITYHLYITYSLNALDENPTFHTKRVTDDPVQMGSICLNSGDCRDIGGSNRNLLDFNDLHIDREGRVYVAFADGCTGECATKENATAADSRDGRGSVYFMANGPSLYVEVGEMMSPASPPTTEEPDKMDIALRIEVAREESDENIHDLA